jgi:hypothetical protein
MNDQPEIVLNLWYVLATPGTIYSLQARMYVGYGSDSEKLGLLRRFAPTDGLYEEIDQNT